MQPLTILSTVFFLILIAAGVTVPFDANDITTPASEAYTPSILQQYNHGVLDHPRSRQATRQSVVLRMKIRERGLRARQATVSNGVSNCFALGSTPNPSSGTAFRAGVVLNTDGLPTGTNVSRVGSNKDKERLQAGLPECGPEQARGENPSASMSCSSADRQLGDSTASSDTDCAQQCQVVAGCTFSVKLVGDSLCLFWTGTIASFSDVGADLIFLGRSCASLQSIPGAAAKDCCDLYY